MAVIIFGCVFVLLLVWNLSDVKKGKNGAAREGKEKKDFYGSDAFSSPDSFADARMDAFPNRAAAMDYWTKHSKYSPFKDDE